MIVITGASRGLGLAIAERLTQNNLQVLGLSRSPCDLGFETRVCDVSDYESIKQVARELKSNGTPITGLVNAAGIASMNLAVTTPPETTHNLIATNLVGTIFCSQIFAPLMMRQGGGSIINFSTIAVALALRGESVYAATKAGVEGFSRSLARELSDFGIRVNCVAPGPINTDLLKGVTVSQIEKIVSRQIIAKQFLPSDVADVVELLLDPRSASISGHTLSIGGS
jgi:3-oxoacyl-[acyl-carrier protein] reductase